jgi:protein ImuA
MQGSAHRRETLAALRTRIASIEKRPALADPALAGTRKAAPGLAAITLPQGLLHELFTDSLQQSAAMLGFGLGLARLLETPGRNAALFVQLTHEAQQTGLPYGPGLAGFGIDPARLIVARLATPVELLWAIEEAVACQAIAVVIADIGSHPKALDFTASRRLSLRAGQSGASVMLLRYGGEREASAARLRWRIDPVLSQPPPFDRDAPGGARWRVTLEKGRLGNGLGEAGAELWLDWTDDGFVTLPPAGGSAVREPDAVETALSRSPPAALGHRIAQAG